jgi:tRNA modification GTPase
VLGFHRAIVNPMPGTTRDVVSEGSAVDGWPVEFSDTAGIRQAAGEIEKIGIEKAQQTIDLADVVIGVVDAVEPDDPIDRSPDIVVVNKSDLVDSAKIDLIVENVNARFAKAVCVTASATTGDGVDLLLDAIAKVLCPEVPPAGQAFPVTQSQVDWLKAEQIR